MILAYNSGIDPATSILIGLTILGIGIALLVFVISHMSRQTRGIEEIYKLLYQMQAKGSQVPDNSEDENNGDTPVSDYIRNLKEREERARQYAEPPKDKPMTKGEKIAFGISMGIMAIVFAAIIIYSIIK